MNKFLLISMLGFMTSPLIAQDIVNPVVFNGLRTMQISPNGVWMAGKDKNYSTTITNILTGETNNFGDFELYSGNIISDNGVLGATTANDENGWVDSPYLLTLEGEIELMPTQRSMRLGGVSADGTRICGFYNSLASKVPFYYDVADSYDSYPVMLPIPDTDIFGNKPEQVDAQWISADGTLIAGMVTAVNEALGTYSYPILFRQDGSGKWSYACPTLSLFNPDGLELPPTPQKPPIQYPDEVWERAYLTEEEYRAWQQAVNEWYEENGGGVDADWSTYPSYSEFMTNEKRAEYEKALEEYYEQAVEYDLAWAQYYQDVEKYNENMEKIIGVFPNFIDVNMALSCDGSFMACTRKLDTALKVWVFNLEESTFSELISDFDNIVVTQILSNGTILGATQAIPTNSYIYMPGENGNDFISFMDFIEGKNPEVYEWINSTLFQGVSGTVFANEGMTTFVGSTVTSNYEGLTYAILSEESSVKNIYEKDTFGKDASQMLLRIYNLQGVNIANSYDESIVKTLPSGIYIVNGKKLIVRN